jgi:hypothetical protein
VSRAWEATSRLKSGSSSIRLHQHEVLPLFGMSHFGAAIDLALQTTSHSDTDATSSIDLYVEACPTSALRRGVEVEQNLRSVAGLYVDARPTGLDVMCFATKRFVAVPAGGRRPVLHASSVALGVDVVEVGDSAAVELEANPSRARVMKQAYTGLGTEFGSSLCRARGKWDGQKCTSQHRNPWDQVPLHRYFLYRAHGETP